MGAWVDRFGLKLLDASLAVTLLTGVFSLVIVASRQPARRISLARAAILGALLIVPLAVFSPLPRLEFRRLFEAPVLKDHPLLTNIEEHPSTPPARGNSRWSVRPVIEGITKLAAGSYPSRCLILIYLLGVSAFLGWLFFGYWGVGWLTRRSRSPSPEAMSLYHSIIRTTDGRRWPDLRITSRVRRPVLLGLFHETILIPESYDTPEMHEQLRLSLLHELAHSQSGDPWFSLASEVAQALWFFIPTLWWIRSQMRLDQEFLADRHAASGFGPTPTYASSLMNLAAPSKASSSGGTGSNGTGGGAIKGAGIATTGSALFQRVLMLIQCPFPVESRPPLWWTWFLVCFLLLGTVGASSLSLRNSRSATPNETTSEKFNLWAGTYSVPRLTLKPDPKITRNRNTVLELPFHMTDQFRVELDLWGGHESISKVRILGQQLQVPHPAPSGVTTLEDWHHVQIQRDNQGISVRVDGQPINIEPGVPLTRWLSIETPPGVATHVENLIVHW